MKILVTVFALAAVSVAAFAEEKPLDTVIKVPNIEKKCGEFFAITTYGTGKDAFLIFHPEGDAGNDSVSQSSAQHEVRDGAPMVEKKSSYEVIFRMNEADWEKAKPCFGQ